MKPKHFWWLVAAEQEKSEPNRLPKEDRDAILEALNGNPKGDFW